MLGPNLSEKLDKGLPAATVLASKNERDKERVKELFLSDILRVYIDANPIDTELGETLILLYQD